MAVTTAAGTRKMFKCYECVRDLGSASTLSKHFRLFPDHRNEEQLRKHEYQKKWSAKKRRAARREAKKNGMEATKHSGTAVAFCTRCGEPRGSDDRFCGFCGHEHT